MLWRALFFSTVVFVPLLGMQPLAAQARMEAQVSCAETPQSLVYHCAARIADAGSDEGVTGLSVEVKADMPAMPMAHNIPPVEARETGLGVYAFPIKLDMYGKWAFSVRISGARQDLLVDILDLQPSDQGG